MSEPTARNHLRTFVETGIAETVETGRGTQYKRSRQTVAMERISALHTELSREELTAGIKELRDDIRAYQDEHDATDPDDLALQSNAGEDDAWADVASWRAAEENSETCHCCTLDIAKAALTLYDFDPDASNGQGTTPDDYSTAGAFARERDELST